MTGRPTPESSEGPVLPAHQLVGLALTRPLTPDADDNVARVQRVLLEALRPQESGAVSDTTFASPQ